MGPHTGVPPMEHPELVFSEAHLAEVVGATRTAPAEAAPEELPRPRCCDCLNTLRKIKKPGYYTGLFC
jgi:hypothetical protein